MNALGSGSAESRAAVAREAGSDPAPGGVSASPTSSSRRDDLLPAGPGIAGDSSGPGEDPGDRTGWLARPVGGIWLSRYLPPGALTWILVVVWISIVGTSFTEHVLTARDQANTLVPAVAGVSEEQARAQARAAIRSSALSHLAFGIAGVVLLSMADSWIRRRDRDLAQQRAQFAAMFESTPDLLVLKDRNLVYRSVNPAFVTFFGRPAEDLIGRSDADLFPAADVVRYREEDLKVLAHGLHRAADEATRFGGEQRWLHVARTPVRDARGRVAGVLCAMRDVTARRESEAALAHRDAILSAAQSAGERFLRGRDWLELMPEVLAEVGQAVDVSRAYLFENREGADGCPLAVQRHEWVAEGTMARPRDPRSQMFLLPERSLARWSAALARREPVCDSIRDLPPEERDAMDAHGVRTVALVPIHAGTRWWGFIGFDECRRERAWQPAELDALQVLAQMIGSCIERQRIESALRDSERKYRLLVENLPAGVVIHDVESRVVFSNGEARRILGLTESEVAGRTATDGIWKFLRSDGSPMPEAEYPVQVVRAAQQPVRNVVVGVVAPGREEPTWGLANGYPVHDADGRLQRIVITFVDITEHRRLEDQFRQAQKMEAVGQLAGGVAHDFNNILTATLMQLGLLREITAELPEAGSLVRELEQGATRAANLTRQLLLFSRKSVLKIRPLDLNELVADLLGMLRRLLGESIRLELREQSPLPPVEADASLLGQVVLNLCLNARDAMPRHGRLTLATRVVEFSPEQTHGRLGARPGSFVCLSVSDTGTGIAPTVLPHIFEPFFTTKEVGKGTGLGLATVHGIVEQHRGWVEVDTALNHGSTFRVFLPVARAGAPATVAADVPSQPRGSEMILVVEDELEVRNAVSRCLRRWGYEILEAGTAREALALWSAHAADIDLVFTDQILPDAMTGHELARLMMRERPELRVILSSGYFPENLPSPAPGEPAFVQFPKPYDLEALGREIRQVLDRPPSRVPPATG